LIAYRRPDAAGPRGSDFVRVPVPDPDALLAALTLVPGVRVVVRKRREVWLRGNVRFHIDAVEGLGDYLEYEVGVGDSETAALAQAAELDRRFGLTDATCFAGSYADLLEQQN
jgi:adenylate cyclase class IV